MSESGKPKGISRRTVIGITAGAGTLGAVGAFEATTGKLGIRDALLPKPGQESEISMLKTIKDPLKRPIYFGVAANDDSWIPSEKGFDTFERLGKPPAIRHFYQDWSGKQDASAFQTLAMETIRQHGSISLITWMPSIAGIDAFAQPDFALRNIASGKFDDHIKKWAQDAKAWGHPFFLIFGHEMNGGWYPWGVGKHWQTASIPNNNTSDDFKAAWKHCHDIFDQVGANPTWVWSPDTAGDINLVKELYPGDEYVDWTGMNGYNWGDTYGNHKINFTEIFDPLYQKLLSIAPNKPIMIPEFGVSVKAQNRDTWLKDVLEKQLPSNFPQVQAAIYFDRDKTQTEGVSWIIEGDRKMEDTFSESIKRPFYKGNEFASLPSGKIPIAKSA